MVKDSDLVEERRTAEKTEKEAQERAEAERQEKLRAEREKAAEKLKTAKEKAREAETERAAAEKAKRDAEAAAKSLNRTIEILREANERHASRTEMQVEGIQNRWERTKIYKSLINSATSSGIEFLKVKKLKKRLSDDEIIERIGGGDLSKGSCSSLALAYAANKAGYDVLDFRGGDSLKLFSSTRNILSIVEKGGFTAWSENGYKAVDEVLGHVEIGKEYYFSAGKHAAIVRNRVGVGFEFLELQSSSSNGFKLLTMDKLKKRFDVKKSRSTYGIKLKMDASLIDISQLADSPKFKTLIGYLNTNETKQLKGKEGYEK